jgi:hypothetical protein
MTNKAVSSYRKRAIVDLRDNVHSILHIIMQGSQSLCDLMRYHGYLFVHPMFWTARHLEVTGSRFEDVESTDIAYCNTPQACHLPADQNQELLSHPKRLATSSAPLVKENALSNILCYEGSPFVKRV